MKQFNAFASTFRINTLLCCGAAVLLSACGGSVDIGAGQLSATAASVSTDAGAAAAAGAVAPAPAVEAIAEAAPAAPVAGTEAAAAAAAPTPAGAAATDQAGAGTQEFALTGYGSKPQQGQAGQQDAPIKQ